MTMKESPTSPILEARGLKKMYGHVTALRNLDFDIRPGEVLGVIGDNGAGKSTLIKCLSGAEKPDEGTIAMEGASVKFSDPSDARAAGIETVYQTLAVAPSLDIASNLFLGREKRIKGWRGTLLRTLDDKKMREQAAKELDDLGILTVQNIRQPVETLSGGQRQAVAVARAAAFSSKLIILDEPTAALGVRESQRVLKLIDALKQRGLSIVFVSHNMEHVFQVCDRIHVQRLGKRVAVVDPTTQTMSDAVSLMTGAVSGVV